MLLVLAFLLRFQPVFFSGYGDPDSYFHERNIETIVSQQSAFFFDSLSQQGRYYSNFPLFHLPFAIEKITTSLPTSTLLLLMPALFGVFTVLFVFVLAKRLFGENIAFFSAFSLAIMPLSIIRTNGVARPDALAMLLLLCCFFAVLAKKNKTAVLLSFAIALANPVPSSIVLLGIMFVASIVLWLKKRENFFSLSAVMAIASALAFFLWTLNYPSGFLGYFSPIAMNAMELQKTDFVWLVAALKFSWLFIPFGFFAIKNNWFLKTWLLLTGAIAFVAVRMALFFALPAAIFSGIGLASFSKKTRPHKRAFFALLFILALLNVFPEIWNSKNYLSAEEKFGLQWLKQNSVSDANIAGAWDFGDPIAAITNRAVLMDGHFEFNPIVGARYKDEIALENSNDCALTQKIVSKYSINYFFADKETVLFDYNCALMDRVFDANRTKIFRFS